MNSKDVAVIACCAVYPNYFIQPEKYQVLIEAIVLESKQAILNAIREIGRGKSLATLSEVSDRNLASFIYVYSTKLLPNALSSIEPISGRCVDV